MPPDTVEEFFEGRPGALALYRVLEGLVARMGEYKVRVNESGITFKNNAKFAHVSHWFPGINKENSFYLWITYDHGHREKSNRFEPEPGKRTPDQFLIEREEDFDDEVRIALRKAYNQSLRKRKRRSDEDEE